VNDELLGVDLLVLRRTTIEQALSVAHRVCRFKN